MRRLVTIGIALGLLFGPHAALAGSQVNRKSPPRISLRYQGDAVQWARPYTFCWSYTNGNEGTAMCADGFPRYRRAVEVNAPHRLVIRVHYPAKPERWFLNAYRAIVRHEHYDETVGDPQRIPFKMRPKKVDGRIRAWNLIFKVEEGGRHYYLDTGGDLAQGDAFYALHVRT